MYNLDEDYLVEEYENILSLLEDYRDLLLLEASSTQKYLAHHSNFGTWAGGGIFSFFNSCFKQGDGNLQVRRLYPKYREYCAKKNIKPLPIDDFVREGKKFYEHRKKSDLTKAGVDIVSSTIGIPGGWLISSGVKHTHIRSDKFKKDAGMIDDMPDDK